MKRRSGRLEERNRELIGVYNETNLSTFAIARQFKIQEPAVRLILRQEGVVVSNKGRADPLMETSFSELHQIVGRNIGYYRVLLRIGYDAFAEAVDIPRKELENLEAGRYNITLVELIKIADALNITVERLMGGHDEETKPNPFKEEANNEHTPA